jgi:hypothetical protein
MLAGWIGLSLASVFIDVFDGVDGGRVIGGFKLVVANGGGEAGFATLGNGGTGAGAFAAVGGGTAGGRTGDGAGGVGVVEVCAVGPGVFGAAGVPTFFGSSKSAMGTKYIFSKKPATCLSGEIAPVNPRLTQASKS